MRYSACLASACSGCAVISASQALIACPTRCAFWKHCPAFHSRSACLAWVGNASAAARNDRPHSLASPLLLVVAPLAIVAVADQRDHLGGELRVAHQVGHVDELARPRQHLLGFAFHVERVEEQVCGERPPARASDTSAPPRGTAARRARTLCGRSRCTPRGRASPESRRRPAPASGRCETRRSSSAGCPRWLGRELAAPFAAAQALAAAFHLLPARLVARS